MADYGVRIIWHETSAGSRRWLEMRHLLAFGFCLFDQAGCPLFTAQAKGYGERQEDGAKDDDEQCCQQLGADIELLKGNKQSKYLDTVFRSGTDS